MNLEEAVLNLCAEAAIHGVEIRAIVCDWRGAELLHGEGAKLFTGCGPVEIRVDRKQAAP